MAQTKADARKSVDGRPYRRTLPVGGVTSDIVTDDIRPFLIRLSNLALDNYNVENRGANFVLHDLDVKYAYAATSGFTYYIAFRAKTKDHSNSSSAITFEANVWDRLSGPPVVRSCSMKMEST